MKGEPNISSLGEETFSLVLLSLMQQNRDVPVKTSALQRKTSQRVERVTAQESEQEMGKPQKEMFSLITLPFVPSKEMTDLNFLLMSFS